jgi:hypothetical protein
MSYEEEDTCHVRSSPIRLTNLRAHPGEQVFFPVFASPQTSRSHPGELVVSSLAVQ